MRRRARTDRAHLDVGTPARAGGPGARPAYAGGSLHQEPDVELHLTPEATELIRRKGGAIAIDLVRAVG